MKTKTWLGVLLLFCFLMNGCTILRPIEGLGKGLQEDIDPEKGALWKIDKWMREELW